MENWDRNEHQGRSKKQVESNEKIMSMVLSAAIFCAIVSIIIKLIF